MFIDEAKIYVKAGNGGDGCQSFYRDKWNVVGSPYLKGFHVVCEVVRQMREPKVIAYKYKKRKSEKKKIGHRRDVTVLRVKEIEIAKG